MRNCFVCKNCRKEVLEKALGVQHRNHCPYCLWSKHVDKNTAGDRTEMCHGLMEPTGLTFKKVKPDKYGKERIGELMIVHQCQSCDKVTINRIAGDDDPNKIMQLASKENKKEVERQLFGKK